MEEVQTDKTRAFWITQIDAYAKKAAPWETKAKKIIKRYMAEKPVSGQQRAKYNILWSNVQTLLPAIYDRAPKPNIERRFNKNDVLGREASTILERSVEYFIDTDEFSDKVRQCALDRLLAGRGTIWVRYEPTIEQVFNAEGSAAEGADDTQITDDVQEQVKYEDVSFDYVHFEDFGHTIGRTWQEVRAVWRRVCMDRQQLIKRFGDEIGSVIPLNAKDSDAPKDAENDRAEIFEIWDKTSRKVYWICKDHPEVLDEQDDPLKLKDFFPCPKPIYATLANNGMIPTPDYEIYYDQAREMDVITGRIDLILDAVKVAGVYDSSAEGVQNLLTGENENKLIPISNWAVFGDKGGLKGVIEFMPLEQIVNTLKALYDARERVKQDLYEITGMSDIIRGESNPNETATAQQIKGQYASMRLGDMQKDVARFCRDLVRITAEVISNLFSPETIKQISSSDLMTEQEKQMAEIAQQMGQPAQVDPAKMQKPSFDDVMGLLRDDMARCFRISIETDSTIKVDQDAEKAARSEFLTAAGGFIQQAAQVQLPELQPLLMDMLLFGVRGFRAGRQLEGSFEEAIQKMQEKAKQPPAPQPPDPAMVKAEAEAQSAKMGMQMAQQKFQLDAQSMQLKAQLESAKAQADMQIKQMDVQLKMMDVKIKEIELLTKQTQAAQPVEVTA